MKKLSLLAFVVFFTNSCFVKNFTPELCTINIIGGKDMEFTSYAIVSDTIDTWSGGEDNFQRYNAYYGDGIVSSGSHLVTVDYTKEFVVTVYPSDAHNVNVFIDGNEHEISDDNYISLSYAPRSVDVVFLLTEPYIKEPALVANTYEIKTVEELKWISSQSQKSNTFKDKTVKLMNNIDMDNKLFTGFAIGSKYLKFDGTFDGNGYEIKNLNIKAYIKYIGLIGILGENGIVKNLSLNGKIIGSRTVGSVVGENYGVIENCINNVSLEGYEYVGGIAGWNNGTIKNVENKGIIKGEKDYLGQIVGVEGENSVVENAIENGSVVEL